MRYVRLGRLLDLLSLMLLRKLHRVLLFLARLTSRNRILQCNTKGGFQPVRASSLPVLIYERVAIANSNWHITFYHDIATISMVRWLRQRLVSSLASRKRFRLRRINSLAQRSIYGPLIFSRSIFDVISNRLSATSCEVIRLSCLFVLALETSILVVELLPP